MELLRLEQFLPTIKVLLGTDFFRPKSVSGNTARAASDNLAGLEYSVLKLRLICFVFRPLFWPLKNVFKPENGLQKNPLAEPGLKIEIFASVNIATAFSDSISNVHSVDYLANMGMWKIQGKNGKEWKRQVPNFVRKSHLRKKFGEELTRKRRSLF